MNEEGYPNPLYRIAALYSVAFILVTSVISMAFFAVNGAELHTLNDSVGLPEFIISLLVFLLCLALLVKELIDKTVGTADPSKVEGRFRTSGIAAGGSALAVLIFLSIVMVLALQAVGAPIEESFMDGYTDLELGAMFMIAGSEEEFICRLLLIGLPVAVIALLSGHGHSARMLFGGFGTTKAAWVFIIISALIFGLLHLEGWNASKVPQIFVSGLIFGYMFCEYGLHVTIVMHTVLDCSSIIAYFSEGAEAALLLGLAAAGLVLLVMIMSDIRHYMSIKDYAPECAESVLRMWTRH